MESTIPTQFWGLYAAGELRPVQQFCELGKALELLAASSSDQELLIPDCPACEVWGAGFRPVQQFSENFHGALPPDFTVQLQQLWDLGNGLSDTALRCEDRAIFSNFEWDSVRVEASKALVMMGWESLKAYADELLRECREAR